MFGGSSGDKEEKDSHLHDLGPVLVTEASVKELTEHMESNNAQELGSEGHGDWREEKWRVRQEIGLKPRCTDARL